MHFPEVEFHRINKVQGQPFMVEEIVSRVNEIMDSHNA